jgi:hypothetical protein
MTATATLWEPWWSPLHMPGAHGGVGGQSPHPPTSSPAVRRVEAPYRTLLVWHPDFNVPWFFDRAPLVGKLLKMLPANTDYGTPAHHCLENSAR